MSALSFKLGSASVSLRSSRNDQDTRQGAAQTVTATDGFEILDDDQMIMIYRKSYDVKTKHLLPWLPVAR